VEAELPTLFPLVAGRAATEGEDLTSRFIDGMAELKEAVRSTQKAQTDSSVTPAGKKYSVALAAFWDEQNKVSLSFACCACMSGGVHCVVPLWFRVLRGQTR